MPWGRDRGARLRSASSVALLLFLVGCGSGGSTDVVPPPPGVARITLVAGGQQSAAAGTALPAPVTVRLEDASGNAMSGRAVDLQVVSGNGWVVTSTVASNSRGEAHAEWYVGPRAGVAQELRITHGTLAVTVVANATPPVPGTSYFGASRYVEYVAGDGPIVLSAPHGGALAPPTIPDRTSGTTVTDANTEHLSRVLSEAIHANSGQRPHLVVSHLRRIKLDPNRDIGEGAAGQSEAERAWKEYHGFIEAARAAAVAAGASLYIDVHGHGHTEQRLEFGYLLTTTDLSRADSVLDTPALWQQTSIRQLVSSGSRRASDWIRGAASLGAAFEAAGYPSMPSPSRPAPGELPYFSGGYSTERHGSRDDGTTNAVQLEANFAGVRDSEANRLRFAGAAAPILTRWGR